MPSRNSCFTFETLPTDTPAAPAISTRTSRRSASVNCDEPFSLPPLRWLDFALEPEPLIVEPSEKLTKDIAGKFPQSAFDFASTGGPFGRDQQIFSASSYPGKAFLLQQETFQDAVGASQIGTPAQPWVEGLATLFDATQDEVFAQFAALGPDAKEAESQLVRLPKFHRIAYEYLATSVPAEIAEDAKLSDGWLPLLIELDQARIPPRQLCRELHVKLSWRLVERA